LGPAILASRMVRDYTEGYYLPAATTSRRLAGDDFAASRELASWKRRTAEAWPAVAVRRVENGVKERLLGARFTVRAFVELGDLDPSEVEGQVAHGRAAGDDGPPQPGRPPPPRRLALRGRGPPAPPGRLRLPRPRRPPPRRPGHRLRARP